MPSWTPHSLNPSQGTEGVTPSTNLLLFQSGSNLYYVTGAQVGVAEATFNLWIQKSTDGGVTWSLIYNGPKQPDQFCVVQVGAIIYIFADDTTLVVYRFDTSTDTFLTTTDSGLTPDSSGISASVFSDGKALVGFVDSSGFSWSCVIYDTVTDTWGSPVVIDSSRQELVGQATLSGIAFVFAIGSGNVISCAPVSNPTTVGTIVTVATLTGVGSSPDFAIGTPCVSNGDVILPYVDPSDYNHPTILYAARSTASTSLSFSSEIIDNTVTPPNYLETIDGGTLWFGQAAIDVSGTAYVFYSFNVNDLDNSASQTSILYRTSTTPGTWSAMQTMWTGPVPSSSMSLYPLLLSSGQIGLIEAYSDPTLFFITGGTPSDKFQSLTVIYLAPGASLKNYTSGKQGAVGGLVTGVLGNYTF